MISFLPNIRVTTIVSANEHVLKHCHWEAAQGDDFKNQRPTIELNLLRTLQNRSPEETSEEIVRNWISLYIILTTRQDLIHKQVRGWFSEKSEQILETANFKAVLESPQLLREYSITALANITLGRWLYDSHYVTAVTSTHTILSDWLKLSLALEESEEKCYICGKYLFSSKEPLQEALLTTLETPYIQLELTPFIKTLVYICNTCIPLAKGLGLELKTFKVKRRRNDCNY